MKYQHRQSLEIAVSAEFDEKFKTYLVTLQDGSTKNVSSSTFKRWWKKLNDDVKVGTPEANAIANDIEAILDDDTMCADGRTYAEIGKEIAEQAKQKAEQAKLVPMPGTQDPDWGKKQWAPENKPKHTKATIQNTRKKVQALLQNSNFSVLTYDKLPNLYILKLNKQRICEFYVGGSVRVRFKECDIIPEFKNYTKVNNNYMPYSCKLDDSTLEDDIKAILTGLEYKYITLSTLPKEEK